MGWSRLKSSKQRHTNGLSLERDRRLSKMWLSSIPLVVGLLSQFKAKFLIYQVPVQQACMRAGCWGGWGMQSTCWSVTRRHSGCCYLSWRKACGGMQVPFTLKVSTRTNTDSYSFSCWNVPKVAFQLFSSSAVIPEMLECQHLRGKHLFSCKISEKCNMNESKTTVILFFFIELDKHLQLEKLCSMHNFRVLAECSQKFAEKAELSW